MRRLMTALAACTLSASAAHAGELVNDPHWLMKPSPQELERYYPDSAQQSGVPGGKVVLRCRAAADGFLDNCMVVSEAPAHLGFGRAAVAAVQHLHKFQIELPKVDSAPMTDAEVIFPFVFGQPTQDAQRLHVVVVSAPTRAEISAAFPQNAIGKVASAEVVLDCHVRIDDGGLTDCVANSTSPDSPAFSHAALQLSSAFKFSMVDLADFRGVRVQVPITFHDPSAPTVPPTIRSPVWIHEFDPGDLATIYPARAIAAGVRSGRGEVDCGVAHSGELIDCKVVAETPTGLGFDEATLKVAAQMAMSPWTADGEPVEGARIRFPVELDAPSKTAKSP